MESINVKELFDRIKQKPIRKTWIDKNGCCLLTAMCLDKGLSAVTALYRKKMKVLFETSENYLLGLRNGWDGIAIICPFNKEYCLGHSAGKAYWKETERSDLE